MSYLDWKDKVGEFKQIDVRGVQGNFFQGIKKQAVQLPAGNGLEIVQSFDPIPLYEVMEDLGFEHHTEKKGDAEFHAYFYRAVVKAEEKDIPMRPSPGQRRTASRRASATSSSRRSPAAPVRRPLPSCIGIQTCNRRKRGLRQTLPQSAFCVFELMPISHTVVTWRNTSMTFFASAAFDEKQKERPRDKVGALR